MAGNYFTSLFDPEQDPDVGQTYASQNQSQVAAPQPAPQQPRQRMSTIDVIGTLLDGVASMGGSEPKYWSTIHDQQDRARQAEADQMARDKFALEQQKFGLDNTKAQNEILDDTNKRFGAAASYVQGVYKTRGPQLARATLEHLMPRLGLTPDQTATELQNYDADPEDYVNRLSVFTGTGKNTGYGTTIQYVKAPDGTLHAFQASEAGGLKEAPLPEGYQLQPGVQFQNNGVAYVPASKITGEATGPGIPIVANVEQGVNIVPGQNGAPPAFTPIPGGKQDIEFNKAASDLQAVEQSLAASDHILPELRTNIDQLARSGSLTGVPDNAVGVDGQPIRGGSRLGAIAMQNVPFLEQATNEQGFSARENIRSIGMSLIQQVEPLLQQAQQSNANLTSRMMDTPKELEGLLSQVINTKDYNAALAAYNRFEQRTTEVRRELREQIARAQSKTAAGRQAAPKTGSQSIPSITDDVGYNALPSGTTYRAPDGSIRRKN